MYHDETPVSRDKTWFMADLKAVLNDQTSCEWFNIARGFAVFDETLYSGHD